MFADKERINGSQAATLRGVGYAMQVSEDERVARLFTNVTLEQSGAQ